MMNDALFSKIKDTFLRFSEALKEYKLQKINSKLSVKELQNLFEIEGEFEKKLCDFRQFLNENIDEMESENVISFGEYFDEKSLNSFFRATRFDDVIRVELPPLLHKKNYKLPDKKSNELAENYFSFRAIDRNLRVYLQRFFQREGLKKYDCKVVIIVQNVFEFGTEKKTIPDTDNHEYYTLINTLTSVFLRDDTPEFVSHFHDSVYGKENKTIVHIVPINRFKVIEKIMQNPYDFSVDFDEKMSA